jgi:hypothetical protein
MRIDPHLLTPARKSLESESLVLPYTPKTSDSVWYRLKDTPAETVNSRLAEQLPVYEALLSDNFKKRMGQTLEIAILRALQQQTTFSDFLGNFLDLESHEDDQLYSKEEPPRRLGKRDIGGDRRLDFLVRHPTAGWAGIEAKNGREWIYPNRNEVKEVLGKCLALDAVPVLVARRIQSSTFVVWNACGVILHQTYNQLFPTADTHLADQAKHKNNLGYHDIRTGNTPDARLMEFIGKHLPALLPAHREKFEEYKDLLQDFVDGSMKYPEFVARARRRKNGLDEDIDYGDIDLNRDPDDEPWEE